MKHYRQTRQPSKKPFVRARKSLGQNFLVDKNAVSRIIESCHLGKDDVVIEIGPGTGLLTREIAPRVKQLIAVEKDPRFCEQLTEEFRGGNTRIVRDDFLNVNLAALIPAGVPVKVIGNLPYYITTPIISAIIDSRRLFSEFYLMVQLEFAERIAAKPGGKDYGAFSCYAQFYGEPTLLFKIKSSSFKPRPKVDSCFMRLALRPQPAVEVGDEVFFFKIVRTAFQQRRKTLGNSLSALFSKDAIVSALTQAGIDPQRRAESLSLADFARLSGFLKLSDLQSESK